MSITKQQQPPKRNAAIHKQRLNSAHGSYDDTIGPKVKVLQAAHGSHDDTIGPKVKALQAMIEQHVSKLDEEIDMLTRKLEDIKQMLAIHTMQSDLPTPLVDKNPLSALMLLATTPRPEDVKKKPAAAAASL